MQICSNITAGGRPQCLSFSSFTIVSPMTARNVLRAIGLLPSSTQDLLLSPGLTHAPRLSTASRRGGDSDMSYHHQAALSAAETVKFTVSEYDEAKS